MLCHSGWPAFGRKSFHYRKLNNFEKGCRFKCAGRHTSTRRGYGGQQFAGHHVNEISPEFPAKQDLFGIDAVTESLKSRPRQEIYATMAINDKQIELELRLALNNTGFVQKAKWWWRN